MKFKSVVVEDATEARQAIRPTAATFLTDRWSCRSTFCSERPGRTRYFAGDYLEEPLDGRHARR